MFQFIVSVSAAIEVCYNQRRHRDVLAFKELVASQNVRLLMFNFYVLLCLFLSISFVQTVCACTVDFVSDFKIKN